MQRLSSQAIVDKYIAADELDGFCAMYMGTFGGQLLRDADSGDFIWMSEQEYETIQREAETEARRIVSRKFCCTGNVFDQ